LIFKFGNFLIEFQNLVFTNSPRGECSWVGKYKGREIIFYHNQKVNGDLGNLGKIVGSEEMLGEGGERNPVFYGFVELFLCHFFMHPRYQNRILVLTLVHFL